MQPITLSGHSTLKTNHDAISKRGKDFLTSMVYNFGRVCL